MSVAGRGAVGVLVPACDEEECIGSVLEEAGRVLGGGRFVLAAGVNGSSDRTAERAAAAGALVGVTPERGYGHGCMAAAGALRSAGVGVAAYAFMAGDGATDPADLPRLVERFDGGADFVLGDRLGRAENRRAMGAVQVGANRLLGLWASALAGRRYRDLGPVRLIEASLFGNMGLREMTYGWTIEAQVKAARLGARIAEIPVVERPRLAGRQKVSGVSLARSLAVGWAIARAGWRARSG